jgi:hypothetical protein
MTTPKPIKRRWVPGLEKRIAAGDNGTLYRYKKTTKTLEPIPMKSAGQMVYVRFPPHDYAYPYAYLIARAFIGLDKAPQTADQDARPRVGFSDGNRLNTCPNNLYWMPTGLGNKLDRMRAKAALESLPTWTASEGEFRQLSDYPNFYVRDDGTLWKLQRNGDLKPRRPHFRADGHLLVNLAPYLKSPVLLKELIADIYLPQRPTPKHRAYMVDGKPTNTHPKNLQWRYSYQSPPHPHRMTATDPSRASAYRSEEAHARFFRTMDGLEDMGAARLKSDFRLWVTPDGRIYWIDHETGTRSFLRSAGGRIHIPGGFLDASGRSVFSRSTRGITAGNIVFDAFPELSAEAAKHPDEPAPIRTPHQATYPKDGNVDNTRPDNLLLMATPHATKVFEFMPGGEAARLGESTTTHPTAAHSEPPADPTTDQDSSPDADAFEFDL